MTLQELEQQALTNLKSRTAFIPETRNRLTSSRGKFLQNVKSLSPDTVPVEQITEPIASGLESESEESLRAIKLKQSQQKFYNIFNFYVSRLTSAGYDREQAEQTARQYAMDEIERANIKEEGNISRERILEREKIENEYKRRLGIMSRDIGQERRRSALKMQIISQLGGFAGSLLAIKGIKMYEGKTGTKGKTV